MVVVMNYWANAYRYRLATVRRDVWVAGPLGNMNGAGHDQVDDLLSVETWSRGASYRRGECFPLGRGDHQRCSGGSQRGLVQHSHEQAVGSRKLPDVVKLAVEVASQPLVSVSQTGDRAHVCAGKADLAVRKSDSSGGVKAVSEDQSQQARQLQGPDSAVRRCGHVSWLCRGLMPKSTRLSPGTSRGMACVLVRVQADSQELFTPVRGASDESAVWCSWLTACRTCVPGAVIGVRTAGKSCEIWGDDLRISGAHSQHRRAHGASFGCARASQLTGLFQEQDVLELEYSTIHKCLITHKALYACGRGDEDSCHYLLAVPVADEPAMGGVGVPEVGHDGQVPVLVHFFGEQAPQRFVLLGIRWLAQVDRASTGGGVS